MAFRLIALLIAVGLIALPGRAETLPDPTRPAVGSAEAAPGEAAAAGAPRVTLIRIAPNRRSAVIDGQEVTVGSRVGDARVVRIAEGEVVLRGPTGTEVLKLFTEVEKRSAASTRKKADAPASRKAQP